MTTSFSAAALRMPHMAFVAAPAPLAHGAPAEPCAPKWCAAPAVNQPRGMDIGGIIAPALGGRRRDTDGGDRFGGTARYGVGSAWQGQDWAQIAGGGPLRG